MKCSYILAVVIAAVVIATDSSFGDIKVVPKKNTATSPYAASAVKAAIREAEVGEKKYSEKYEFPNQIQAPPASENVAVFNALLIEGTASDAIVDLAEEKPLEVVDGGITEADLEKALAEASAIWEDAVCEPCPVTIDDLTIVNQQAAALSCCAAMFCMEWEKVRAKWLGEEVEDGTLIKDAISFEENGKALFKVVLEDGTTLYVAEGKATLNEVKNALKNGATSKVVIPSINVEKENDFEKDYQEFFSNDILEFCSEPGHRCRLGSFKENIKFSLNEKGVFGVSVVTATAFEKGIFVKNKRAPKDVVYIDEPFTLFVETELQDGTDAVLFEVEINHVN